MSFFGVEQNAQLNKLIFDMRLHLSRNKYAPNLRTIYRSFVDYDREQSGKIEAHNFERALNGNGIFMKVYDVQLFRKVLDREGSIDWFEFLHRLKEPMGPLRRQIVEHIFDSMDQEKKGQISAEKLMEHFNPSVVEYYQTGRMSAEQVKEHFLSFLVVNNGAVTKEEFIAFYDDLNVNYAHNDIFFRYVSSQWHYTPDKLQAVSENEIRTAIKNLRYKLIERTQGSKDELLVRKLFDEYDVNKNFYLSSYDLSQMLNKVGIKLSPVLIERVHQRLDKNDSGYIEFEQFKKFLYYEQ